MFSLVFEDHNKEMEVLVGKGEYSDGTLERFITARNFFFDVIKQQYQVADINIHPLTQ